MATSKTKAAPAASSASEAVLIRYPDGAEYVVPSAAVAGELHPEAEVVGPEHPPEPEPPTSPTPEPTPAETPQGGSPS